MKRDTSNYYEEIGLVLKNMVIVSLAIIISILIGIVLVTNYEILSEIWMVGLGLMISGAISGGIIGYSKFRNH
ncbi:hypothetical protein AAA799P11_00130 [Marine Group I thaumarchaeote SCGC AAA799-P11]|uniref:Uncharacterized protein n=1 Tax=Marine Group I thaumarchaeote SCGC AAA799-P11 TaxID=1502295 RepID=A0A087S3S9_9ARCH|nr:hypothetical protein AAA799P11_00130 [Marine Group I thaumarchaeote SCGC AAA799-P11]